MSPKENRPKRTLWKSGLLAVLAVFLAVAAATIAVRFDSPGQVLKDGYYTAQLDNFDKDGWREYLTIFVNDGAVATAELNAVNETGMLRSWNQDYVRDIYLKHRINPNHFARLYCGRLVSFQRPQNVLPAFPARKTHEIFIRLAEAALSSSRAGNLEVVEIPRPRTQFPDDI
jgi:major membrane immunogen (membrane-anchored lipoprotein)